MRVIKLFVLICSMLSFCGIATAQYSFSAHLSITGRCYGTGSSMAERNLRQWVNDLNAKMKSIPLTREECIAMQQQMSGESATMEYGEYGGGCSIKIVISPCVCSVSETKPVTGPDQGESFYSSNPGSEVSDWESDVAAKHDALRKEPLPVEKNGTGDKKYDDALRNSMGTIELPNIAHKLPEQSELVDLANMENVNRYLENCYNLAITYVDNPPSAIQLVDWFHEEFKRVSGFDLDEIMNKLPSERSPEEKQAIIDYHAFRRGLADKMLEDIKPYIAMREETRAYEMAVLSEDCYGDSEHNYIETTNYKRIGTDDFSDGNPMRLFSEVIDRCNKYEGFHAQIYKNEITGEYTLAFEGSNMHPILNWEDFKADWKDCNFIQGMGGVPEQYILAKIIADNVPEGIKINFTGHSLGGGLASVAGAITGLPTYTYNAEGVNKNIIKTFDISHKVKYNNYDIKAYRTDKDELTAVQEDYKYLVIGAVVTLSPSLGAAAGAAIGGVAGEAYGEKYGEAVGGSIGKTIGGDIGRGVGVAVGSGVGLAKGAAVSVQATASAISGNAVSSSLGDKETLQTGTGHSVKEALEYLDGGRYPLKKWEEDIRRVGYEHEDRTQDSMYIILGE